MRTVSALCVAVAVLVTVPTLARAQDDPQQRGGGGGGRRGGRMNMAEQLKPILNLTDDQVTKVKAIEEEFRSEFQKVRDEMQQGGDFQQMREKMQPLRQKMEDKVRALLTDEQKPKFDEWVKKEEERRQQGGGPGGRGRGGPSDKELADRAEKDLTLSPEEKSVVMPLVKGALEARTNARHANDKRREELKKFLKDVPGTTDAQKEEIAAKLKELRKAAEADAAKIKEAQDKLREVLTPDNEAKLIAMGILDWTASSNP